MNTSVKNDGMVNLVLYREFNVMMFIIQKI